jgi:hypothetical protein
MTPAMLLISHSPRVLANDRESVVSQASVPLESPVREDWSRARDETNAMRARRHHCIPAQS